MNASLIGELVKLRYKLLWAKTRSRNGRIALFLVGYLFLILLLVVFATGGLGAGLAAVRSGKAELLAQGVLGGLFLNALLGSVILGFGMSAPFSPTVLRRYPLRSAERMAAEQIVGMLEPIWILIAGIEVGLAFGLYLFGAGSFGLGLLAVVLLCAANFLAARIVLRGAEMLMQNKSGTVVLLFFVVMLSLAPSLLAQVLPRNSALLKPALAVLRFTPPFAAGSLMAAPRPAVALDLGLLAAWCAALFAVLLWLQRRPLAVNHAASSVLTWDGPADRIAAFLFPSQAPLVARWLRYYWRNTRSRFFYVSAVPLCGFLTFMLSHNARHGDQPRPLFSIALGTFALIGFMGTGKIAVNLFGYDGPGFRRYFLVPVDAAATLRAGSYASVLMNAALIPAAVLVWLVCTPFDPRAVVLLGGIAAFSLFLFNGLALWTSILCPRRGDFKSSFGNDMSFGGNVLFVGGVMLPIIGAQILAQFAKPEIVLPYWWTAGPAVVLSIGFYAASLRQASAAFPAHRERLLAMAEGRN